MNTLAQVDEPFLGDESGGHWIPENKSVTFVYELCRNGYILWQVGMLSLHVPGLLVPLQNSLSLPFNAYPISHVIAQLLPWTSRSEHEILPLDGLSNFPQIVSETTVGRYKTY